MSNELDMKDTPTRLYHVSETYLGKSPLFVPRCPLSKAPCESPTPRICVAPTVSGCYEAQGMDSIDFFLLGLTFHVYQVEAVKHIKADKTVPDRELTGERWLLEPHRFEHVLKMPKLRADYRFKPWHTAKYHRILTLRLIEEEFAWELEKRARARRNKEEARAQMIFEGAAA